jgi:hypothetical protein
MKVTFMICMYSGNRNPETELTEEQGQKIVELVSKLNKKCDEPPLWGLGSLGPESYVIVWGNGGSPFDIPSMNLIYLKIDQNGCTCIWYNIEENHIGEKYIKIDYKDTVGLWEYLNPIGIKLLDKHQRDAQEVMDEYNEKMFRVFQQEKV